MDMPKTEGLKNQAGFVTEGNIPKQPVVLSLEQQDDETVELVASFANDGASYRLGFFANGRLNLCVVDSGVLDLMGLDHDVSGRIVVER